ncbi:FAD binding domain-containing protein [Salinibacterium sp. G-O1]|uniref:FAD binding domain-containing protein n=1 Tax=Salinibacterium sp. G-O1 TaxID=3046208 RepID=UPI0024BB90B4|nr:FAD binding domain-containing protein [Salinibacterium sp. G-O1]MDJ0335807.1 FAD binding domain-containing protein [Salinibacterium sp. G-O1]
MDLIDVEHVRVAHTRAETALAPGERAMGGGTWLYSEPQPGLTGIVDLAGMGWEPVVRTAETITIAATCTIETLRRLPEPLFEQCADSLLASWKILSIATVGGNIALALPAGPMTSLAASLDGIAVIWTVDGGERRVPVADFVTGVTTTALGAGEILRSIELPIASLHRTAFRRISRSPMGRTGTLVIGRVDASGETVFTVTGGTPRPRQLRFDGAPSAADLASGVDSIADWYDDPHGAPDWRRAMSMLFVEQIRQELS